ncbi:MAG TPA: hypothetical protein VG013_12295 [Gemmataceae bacterium]|jgi:hypothetical protein|nr:hypothetical protein [Gemmataceae bacterium]
MHRVHDTLDRALEQVVTAVFGPQPRGYRPAPSLRAKLASLAVFAAVVALGIMANW